MSALTKRLREERANAWSNMTAITDLAEREGRELTSEERSKWDEIEARISTLSGDIDRMNRESELEARMSADAPVDDPTLRPTTVLPTDEETEERVSRAFENFVRFGIEGLQPEERSLMRGRHRRPGAVEGRAQSEGTNSAGGYLVPSGYWRRISEVLKAYGGLLGVANVIETSTGQPLPWPSNDDTSNAGHILGENTQVSETDVTIGQKTLNAYTYTSDLVLVSLELLQDTAFDLDAWLPKKLGQRIGRAVANHLVNGTGSSQPTGILNSITTGKTGASGQVSTVIYDDLVDLEHSIDPAYRALGNCRYAMNDLTLGAIRKLKDSQGHPLWNPSLVDSAPDLLLGYPVLIDQAFPNMAASAKSIAFGDFEAGYVVRRVLDMQMMRLEERYADYLQVGFFGFLRLDAKPDDANAVKSYVNAAS
jgi:HK97 family phage major capsid protein